MSENATYDKDNIEVLKKVILHLNNDQANSVLYKWYERCTSNKTFVSKIAMLAIVDLCVSGVSSIDILDTVLDPRDDPVFSETVLSACRTGMICLVEDEEETQKKSIHVPALLLRNYANDSNILLRRMNPSDSNHREYETILVNVMPSRFNALRLVKTPTEYLQL